VIDSDQVLKCRGIQSNDVLDIIKLKPDLIGQDIKPHIVKCEQALVYNPYGGFRVDFANKYIAEYLKTARGQTSAMIRRVSWAEVQKDYKDTKALDNYASL